MKQMIFAFCGLGMASSLVAAQLSSSSYVQDGLVMQFDALENAGVGTHDNAATTWTDLKGSGASITLREGAKFTDRGFDTSKYNQYITKFPALDLGSMTLDLSVNIYSNGSWTTATTYPRLFSYNYCDTVTFHFTTTGTQGSFYLNNLSNDRPSITFRKGTLCCVSDAHGHPTWVDGVKMTTPTTIVPAGTTKSSATWTLNGQGSADASGWLHAMYHTFRYYNRGLSADEILHNATVDKFRYWSYQAVGDDLSTTTEWADVVWDVPIDCSAFAPSLTTTNDTVRLVKKAVHLSSDAALLRISLEDGASITLDEGKVLSVRVLWVEGEPVARGIYSGNAANGRSATWIKGDGVVRVSGSASNETCPTVFVTPDEQGFYTVGLASGSAMDCNWIVGERPVWASMDVVAGTTLKLVGGVLLDEVPAGLFAGYDTTELKNVMCTGRRIFADGTPFVVPKGCVMRQLQPPSAWTLVNGTNKCSSCWTGSVLSNDLVIAGTLSNSGDNKNDKRMRFAGNISGTGQLYLSSFGDSMGFEAPLFALKGTVSEGAPANDIVIRANAATCQLTKVTLSASNIDAQYKFGRSYCNTILGFGPLGSVPTLGELTVGELYGCGTVQSDSAGVPWRIGGAVVVWGGNTLHVGILSAGVHLISTMGEINRANNLADTYRAVAKGIGNVIIDRVHVGSSYSSIFMSTNINLTVGSVETEANFDYTMENGVANCRSLIITNTCVTTAKVKAADLQMLPAKLKGFKGDVLMTNTTAVVYAMPIDFSVGTNGLYNAVGCEGSGTLAQAPANGTLNVTFDTTTEPAIGNYALARFSAGGEKLANWTVTLNGEESSRVSIGDVDVAVRKDSTGIWLAVRRRGLTIILR